MKPSKLDSLAKWFMVQQLKSFTKYNTVYSSYMHVKTLLADILNI